MSLKPSALYHCSSVISETIGLAKMKIRIATPKSPTPIQKRRGGRGTRRARGGSEGPRPDGAEGRDRRGLGGAEEPAPGGQRAGVSRGRRGSRARRAAPR